MKPTMEQLKDTKWWGENAPDGATHYDPNDKETPWMKGNGSGHWFCYSAVTETWEFISVGSLCELGYDPKYFIERPAAASEASVDSTLDQRGNRYGRFVNNGRVSQGVKSALETGANWKRLDDDMKEALFMIGHKMARIVNGDPKYTDSWHDIAGYARLIEQRLEDECKADSEA